MHFIQSLMQKKWSTAQSFQFPPSASQFKFNCKNSSNSFLQRSFQFYVLFKRSTTFDGFQSRMNSIKQKWIQNDWAHSNWIEFVEKNAILVFGHRQKVNQKRRLIGSKINATAAKNYLNEWQKNKGRFISICIWIFYSNPIWHCQNEFAKRFFCEI